MARSPLLLVAILLSCHYILLQNLSSARILAECDAAKELSKAGIPRSFISTYVCIMKSESNLNTSKITGPGHKSSFSYGVFQISSDKWCSRYRPGGICNKKCDDFLNDDIRDDIACAKIIADKNGFKHWNGWLKNCKNGKLPNVGGCMNRRDIEDTEVYPDGRKVYFEELQRPSSLLVQELKVNGTDPMMMTGELK
ncbi:hypothetical protein QAD02_022860 [Eretmocerus hayati]|uniref:Uncharacterized protein n=1 Tax=Eretmocerus hayati TaxID=131215 RepID=A0ACC2PU60_9HYME|nr:hypothetical protein QAD02_022860 [Eretmocerus hayati]